MRFLVPGVRPCTSRTRSLDHLLGFFLASRRQPCAPVDAAPVEDLGLLLEMARGKGAAGNEKTIQCHHAMIGSFLARLWQFGSGLNAGVGGLVL